MVSAQVGSAHKVDDARSLSRRQNGQHGPEAVRRRNSCRARTDGVVGKVRLRAFSLVAPDLVALVVVVQKRSRVELNRNVNALPTRVVRVGICQY